MTFEILGPLRVTHESGEVQIGAAKERTLLAVLLLEQGRVVGVDRLIEELWGDVPPQQPVGSVRVLASRLRRALGTAGCEDRLRTAPPGYVLALEAGELDAQRWDQLAREGAALLASGQARQAADTLRSALALWRGEPLVDVDLGPESLLAVRRLTEERIVAIEQRIEADIQCGNHQVVTRELEELVDLHPLRENFWQMLVLALARGGRYAEATDRLKQLRDVMGDVGLEPSPSFVALERDVMERSSNLEWRDPAPARMVVVAGERPPLPRTLIEGRASELIGRRSELDRLLGLLDGVASGDSATALVSGEPGVGKSALVAEFSALAHEGGATVLYGQCDEDLQIAYQPFREALQGFLASLPPGGVAQVLSHWPRLAGLAGPFGGSFEAQPAPSGDAEGERLLLFESVEGWLRDLASRGSVLLVLDDLHWASSPTVQLLRHLSSQRLWPLMCVATFRDTEGADSSGLREILAGVHRQAGMHRLSLQGLDRDGVAQLVTARHAQGAGQRDHNFAARIYEETGGNPFFATQLVRHLLESGDDLVDPTAQFQLPDGVRDVIRQRIERLSPAANQVLRVAATIGPSSPFPLLAAIPDSGDPRDLLDALDEATTARLLLETPDAEFVFAHALVRKTIYGTLSGARRRQLHRAVADALSVLPTPLPNQTVALAHHLCQGAGPGDGPRAARYALLAGSDALAQVAHEMALEQFERGLEVLEQYGPADDELEADLYLGMAEACNRSSNHHGRSRAAWNAARAARASGSNERLGQAAFWAARYGVVGSLDADVMELCEDAIHALGPDPSPLKARVMGVLASLRALAGEGLAADPIAVEAVEIARAANDPAALVEALDARVTTLAGGPDVTHRLEVAGEMVEIASRCNDLAGLGNGHRFRASARLISGDRPGFDEDFDAMTQLGERMRDGFLRAISAQWRATVALLDGAFAEVESYAGEAVELSHQDTNFVNAWAAQLLWLRHEQGRLGEFLPLIESTVKDNPGIVGFRAALAMSLATLGQREAARSVLWDVLSHPIPHDWIRTASLTLCAEAASILGDAEAAARLEPLLRPYAGQLVLVATGTHCQGAVDRFRGMLATVRGDFARAEAYFSSALALEEHCRTAPSSARTRLWYARSLVSCGDGSDTAAELAREAAITAERLGMAGVQAEAQSVLDGLPEYM